VVGANAELDPHALLEACRHIENDMGRKPGEHWGPRVVDLDVLLYEDRVVEDENLVLPHPRMHERRFVLEPLSEIAPRARHPLLKKTASELLADLGEAGGRVRKLEQT
jgi:2-amino-4-hydroxy-6-hydroxymethyldihydropteridine diphosphokinase